MRAALFSLLLFAVQGAEVQPPASIEGLVLKAGTSTPLVRARVQVLRDGGGLGQTVTTDAGGRFSFPNLQPGRYRLSVSRDGFVSVQYGEGRRGLPGAAITLESRQHLKDIVIMLTPRAAISGRVYDRYGDPVTNATVLALTHTYQDGSRILVIADTAKTNDLGEYRLFWLMPGVYVVGVTPAIAPPPPLAEDVEAYLPAYFPGTTEASSATSIDLPAGVNLTGVDVQIVDTRAVRVRGRVVNGTTGQPAMGTAITLVPRRGTIATGTPQRTVAGAGGAFEFRHMAPGSYDLVATAISNGRLAAHVPIDIGGADIENIGLALQPQFSIAGQLTMDGAPSGSPLPNLNGIRLELRREPYTPELLVVRPTIGPDGTFTLTGVTPGDYQLRVKPGGPFDYVKLARYGAVDALNPPFAIDGPGRLDIVISPNAGSVDGVVLDDAQQPFAEATVVLVPDDAHRHRFDLYYTTSSNAAGRIHLDNVAPGDYRIFAWDDVPSDAWLAPDFIRPFEARGKPTRISEGAKENVEVRLIR